MINKEDVFIRYCACLKADSVRLKKIEELALSALNWEYILKRSQEQGVAALLYKLILKDTLSTYIPGRVMKGLRNYYYSLLERNVLMLKAWEEGLEAFRKERIEVLVFKGPALLELVYKDIGLRPMGDIDILVKFKDLGRAGRILEGMGYRASINPSNISSDGINPQRNSIMYFKDRERPGFFWHTYWHIINFLPYNPAVIRKIDMSRIWQDAASLKANGSDWRGFSLNHHLIYLSLHAFNHRYEPLILLCDLNELINNEKENIHWDILIEESEVLGLEKYLYYSLYVLAKVLNTDIPGRVLERLRPGRIHFWEKKFINAVLEGRPFFLSEILASLAMNENLKDRFFYLYKLLFPSRQEMSIIRQKEPAQVNIADYLMRIGFSFNYYRKEVS